MFFFIITRTKKLIIALNIQSFVAKLCAVAMFDYCDKECQRDAKFGVFQIIIKNLETTTRKLI